MNNLEHFDHFFVLATVGLGLIAAGVANLVFGGAQRNRIVLRALFSFTACGGAVALLAAATRAELAAQAAGLLTGSVLGTALVGSAWAHRRLAALAALARKPVARWGTLAVCGLALVVGAGFRFEATDEALSDQQTFDLELMLGRQPNRPTERARAVTDRGTQVVLKEPQAMRAPELLAAPEEKVLRDTKLDAQVIRSGAPSDASNCHGWVFTGGQFLLGPDDVELILKENAYAEVAEPRPGDVAIYRQSGTISHSAIVRYVSEGRPVLVEGKWGTMGVFLHPVDKTPYGTDYAFYRSTRPGHVLTGLDTTPDSTAHAGVQ